METAFTFINENILLLYLLVFMVILGFQLISNVPTVLHTPLMSGANAISGIVIIGAILIIRRSSPDDWMVMVFGSLAIILGMTNVAGGFAVTNRMLSMFKKKTVEK